MGKIFFLWKQPFQLFCIYSLKGEEFQFQLNPTQLMKLIKILLFTFLLVIFQSCIWNNEPDDMPTEPAFQSNYTAVTIQRAELESSTAFESPRSIINSGKIYVKGSYLFINEKNEGFHVFDNSNPENPLNIGFLKVLGSSDLAVKDDIIYVNNAVDLIAIQADYTTSSIEITKRIPNTFPQMISPDGFQFYNSQQDDIVIAWTLND